MATQATGAAGLAERYALALFELADDKKALDTVASDLASLKAMLAQSDDFQRLVRSPVIARAEQGRAMDALAAKAGFSDLTRRFLGVLAQNRRLFALQAVIDAYLRELARRRGEIAADVVSAKPLSPVQLQAVNDALRLATGAKVAVNATVDPSLIGGLIVKVGSRMVDASVRTKLQKLQVAMKGVG